MSTTDPQNVEAEQSVIGAVLLAGAVPSAVAATGLAPEHFYRQSLGTIYAAALELHAAGAGIDPVLLKARLNGQLDAIGGQATIDLLSAAVPSVGNAGEYARIVIDLARQRRERAARLRLDQAPDDPAARRALAALLDGAPAADRTGIRWLDVGQLLDTDPPDVPWLLRPLLARGALTILAGQPGVGKSLVALAAAAAIAHGAPDLAGLPVTRGTVALLDAENGHRLLHRRAHLVDLPRHGVRLGIAAGWTLLQPEGLADLERQLAPTLPDLIVFDGLASLAPGLNENAADEVELALGRLRRFTQEHDVAGLLLHHTRKEGDTYRGGTALPGACEVLALLRRPDPEAEPDLLELTWDPQRGGKMRLDALPDPIYLESTVTAGRWTLEPAEAPSLTRSGPPATKREVLRGHLLNALEHHGAMKQGELLRAVDLRSDDQTGRRAIRALEQTGDVKRQADGRYLAQWVSGSHDTPPDTGVTVGVSPAGPRRGSLPDTPDTAATQPEGDR